MMMTRVKTDRDCSLLREILKTFQINRIKVNNINEWFTYDMEKKSRLSKKKEDEKEKNRKDSRKRHRNDM